MKKTRRIAAMVAAMALTATMAMPMAMNLTASAAAKPGTITFTDEKGSGHTYTAIQVFKGEAETSALGTSSASLEKIDWALAEGKQVTAFLNALATNTTLKTGETFDFANCSTAADVAGVLSGNSYSNGSDKAKAFAKLVVANKELFTTTSSTTTTGQTTASIAVAVDGYYVIEETGTLTGTDASKSAYILGVYDSGTGAEVNVKSEIPSFQKKIKDINDSTGTASGWQDSADYDIGDQVPFQLKATLPANYADYKSYKLVFHDDLNKSGESDVFTMDDTSKASFSVYVDKDKDGICDTGEALTVTTNYSVAYDGLTDTGCDFEVTIPNLKTIEGITYDMPVYVEYTAKLNENAVIGNPGNWNDAYLEYSNNPNYEGTGDNEETGKTTKDFVVAFTYQTVINKKDGTTHQPLTGAEFTLEKLTGENTWTEIDRVTKTDGSTFTFKGLDDGNYRLKETQTPANYNPINDMYFTINAEHGVTVESKAESGILTSLTGTNNETEYTKGEENLTSAQITFTDTLTDGKLSSDVDNFSGATLPSTGGIGTYLFTGIGGALAVGAGIVLIAKKRAKNEQ